MKHENKHDFLVVTPLSYNRTSKLLMMQVDSPDEAMENFIDQMIEAKKEKKIDIRVKFLKMSEAALRSYRQLQKWFVKVTSIIKHFNPGVKVTKEMKDAMSNELKMRYFEADVIYLSDGKNQTPLPPSLSTMNHDLLAKGIEGLENDYDFVD